MRIFYFLCIILCYYFSTYAEQSIVPFNGQEFPLIQQHLAKYDKLFPALALLFHLVDCVQIGQQNCGPVKAASATKAAAWCEYLESHARRCYGLLADEGLRAAQSLTSKIAEGKLSNNFTMRDVRRNQWRNLTTDEAVKAAIDWLEDEGWLQSYKVGAQAQEVGNPLPVIQLIRKF
jgi:hypothetical protein